MACNAMLGIILARTLAFFFVTLFQAMTIAYNWYGSAIGTTINELGMYIALASYSTGVGCRNINHAMDYDLEIAHDVKAGAPKSHDGHLKTLSPTSR